MNWYSTAFTGRASVRFSLYLIRHGQSEANLSSHKLVTGRQNQTPLTQLGEQQATSLGKWIKHSNLKFDSVYSSTAKRTIQTANFALKDLEWFDKDKLVSSEELLEIDMGDWVGTDRTKCYTQETLAQINNSPWTFAPPNGESQQQVEGNLII